MNFESSAIPPELHNPRALRKMKALYAEQISEHGKNCPRMIRLFKDIQILERELTEDEPRFARRASA